MNEKERYREKFDSALKTVREAYPAKLTGLLAPQPPELTAASRSVDLIVTSICEAVPEREQRQQIVDAIQCLWSIHGDAIRKLTSLTKKQQAARARAARQHSSECTDILIAGLVQRRTKKMTKARSGDALARDIMDDLNELLEKIGEKRLDQSAIAKRIRKNRSRWQMEEERVLEFEARLRQPLASDDFMKPIRDILGRADT